MNSLAAYALLFLAVGAGFILFHLVVGKLIRPARPDAEKGAIYECGEPTIGSAWVQFDLRFYVVALLFVIFDVEVAFFFPWAVVFGKANEVAAVNNLNDAEAYHQVGERAVDLVPPYYRGQKQASLDLLMGMTPEKVARLRDLQEQRTQARGQGRDLSPQARVELEDLQKTYNLAANTLQEGRSLGWLGFWEIVIFFGVLLVGFAYLWQRGDLAWVRSLADRQAAAAPPAPSPLAATKELATVGR
jgi:NADH-quinone oxidoreductase subunit A